MNKEELLNKINGDNMSKKEAMQYLLEIQQDIVPVSYNFYTREDGHYIGYHDKYRGDHFKKLTVDDAVTYLSYVELREEL